jgi:pyridoxine/pyridoxamine 5'-phosphate oxidase
MVNFQFAKDPFDNFLEILSGAKSAGIIEHTAMTLSTIGLDGFPNSRQVLFKGILRQGLSFYTNYEGQKSLEIFKNPHVSLNFFWAQLEKQIRVQGIAEKSTREESEKYFKTRPRESRFRPFFC